MTASKPSVVLSVVSGARTELIVDFLRSMGPPSATDEADVRVVAVVNGRDPALCRDLEEQARIHGRVVDVIENATPLGFAANHNAVMRREDADYFLIANDDVIVSPSAIDRLVRFMEHPENARVAVVSPRLIGPDGAVQGSTYSFPTTPRILLSLTGLRDRAVVASALRAVGRLPRFRSGRSSYWDHDATRNVDTLAGAFVLVRSSAVRAVGVMDEVSLAGGEETEWHKRMADAGWSVVYLADAEVVHLGSQTVGRNPSIQLEYARGWFNYARKHATPVANTTLRLGAYGVYGSRWLWAAIRGDATGRKVAASGLRITKETLAG